MQSDPVFTTREDLEAWERRERETVANEIKYAPAYAAMLGETRIQAMKAAHAHLTKDSDNS